MDSEKDDIDPAWWAAAFDDASVEEYEPAELLSTRLDRLAKQEGIGEFQKMVLETLALATSAMLNPGDWLAPFSPAMEFGNRRSVVPADLTKEQVALLARIARLVDRPDLRSRVADVAWVYGDRSCVAMLDTAIDAYRAAPLTDDNIWFSIGRDAWRRAFELAKRRGADGQVRIQEMTKALKEHVLAGTVADRFRLPDCAALLRENGRVAAVERSEVAEYLATLAAAVGEVDPRLSRHLEREAAAWFGASDADAVNAATDRVARTYIAEADARMAADPVSGAMVEGHFLEKAIATFRTLPRSYRRANGIEDLIVELRDRLHASRETTLENMMRITSGPVDLTNAVSYARERVSGHADRFEALAMFATLAPPMDAERVRTAAEKAVDGSLSRIIGSSTFSRDARKVAASEGSTRHPNDPAVQNEIVRHVTIQAQVSAQGLIWPALELLTFQHRYDRDYITALCAESSTVPEGHAGLWGAGLTFGLAGDYGPAVAILRPAARTGRPDLAQASWSPHLVRRRADRRREREEPEGAAGNGRGRRRPRRRDGDGAPRVTSRTGRGQPAQRHRPRPPRRRSRVELQLDVRLVVLSAPRAVARHTDGQRSRTTAGCDRDIRPCHSRRDGRAGTRAQLQRNRRRYERGCENSRGMKANVGTCDADGASSSWAYSLTHPALVDVVGLYLNPPPWCSASMRAGKLALVNGVVTHARSSA